MKTRIQTKLKGFAEVLIYGRPDVNEDDCTVDIEWEVELIKHREVVEIQTSIKKVDLILIDDCGNRIDGKVIKHFKTINDIEVSDIIAIDAVEIDFENKEIRIL